MDFTVIEGDLLLSDESVIAHGCNTRGAFAAGIAGQIADKYPLVAEEYKAACRAEKFFLGEAQCCVGRSPGWLPPVEGSGPRRVPDRLIFNLGTQREPGADASSHAIWLAFANMAERCKVWNISRVAIPRIGCGIGGLTWPTVASAIENGLVVGQNTELEVVVYDFVPKR